jgi:hypothetical protein
MKTSSSYSNNDQNWRWPEKTWFRERLNAVKARENEERQKSTAAIPSAPTRPSRTGDRDDLK